MQNHLEVSSKNKFWTRNVRNWSKSLYGKFTESIRNLPRPSRPVQEGPYGPIRAHIWAHKGPYMGPNPDRAPTRTGPAHGTEPGPIGRAHTGTIWLICRTFHFDKICLICENTRLLGISGSHGTEFGHEVLQKWKDIDPTLAKFS